jgi:hypothetical protein
MSEVILWLIGFGLIGCSIFLVPLLRDHDRLRKS